MRSMKQKKKINGNFSRMIELNSKSSNSQDNKICHAVSLLILLTLFVQPEIGFHRNAKFYRLLRSEPLSFLAGYLY